MGAGGGPVSFFHSAGRLKSVPRRGWVVKFRMEHPESVADHSYRVALLAMFYADVRGLDTGKAVSMALLHDLPEALTGDSVPGEKSKSEKSRAESRALRSILRDLPRPIAERYYSNWQEYERGVSEEAKLVKYADKLELALQANEYRRADPALDVRDFFDSAGDGMKDAELFRILEVLSRR